MKSNNILLIATAVSTAFMLAACGAKHSATSSPTDSAVAAESELNKSGCSFQETAAFPTTGSEKKTELSCKDVKGVNQTKAVSTYISKVSASMKEKGRKDVGQLQVKLNAATSKLSDLNSKAAQAPAKAPTAG